MIFVYLKVLGFVSFSQQEDMWPDGCCDM